MNIGKRDKYWTTSIGAIASVFDRNHEAAYGSGSSGEVLCKFIKILVRGYGGNGRKIIYG